MFVSLHKLCNRHRRLALWNFVLGWVGEGVRGFHVAPSCHNIHLARYITFMLYIRAPEVL